MRNLHVTALLPLTALLAVGCAGEPQDDPVGMLNSEPAAAAQLSTVRGKLAPGAQAALLASEGAGPATQVRVLDMSGGSPTVVGQGPVASDRSFSVDVPAGAHRLIVTAADASGNTAAARILDVSAAAGGVAQLADLGAESTLEAEVARGLAACGVQMQLIDTVDLQARISELVATAALSAIEAGASVQALVNSLVQAVGVAQATDLTALAGEGVTVTRQDLFEAGLPASIQQQRDLAAGAEPDAAAAAFATGVQEARSALLGPDANARSQVASAIAFGAMAEEEMGLAEQFEELDAVIDAALISAVAPLGLEGVVVALDDIMDPITDVALEELESLLAGLGVGSGVEDTVGELLGTLTGLLDGLVGDGGILGLLGGLGGLLCGDLNGDATALAEARRGELSNSVSAAAAAAAAGGGQCVEFGALAATVAGATSSFTADIHQGVPDLVPVLGLCHPSASRLSSLAEVLSLVEGLMSVGL